MRELNSHFVLQGILQIMIRAGWISITLIESREKNLDILDI